MFGLLPAREIPVREDKISLGLEGPELLDSAPRLFDLNSVRPEAPRNSRIFQIRKLPRQPGPQDTPSLGNAIVGLTYIHQRRMEPFSYSLAIKFRLPYVPPLIIRCVAA